MNEEAIFTVIPAGRVADGLKVTVFVTPRLDAAGGPVDGTPLRDFEAFANWPRTTELANFRFEISNVGVVEGFGLPNPVAPDPQLWDLLFGETVVGAAEFQDFSTAVVNSFPVNEVANALTDLYTAVAVASPTEFPPMTRGPLAQAVAELSVGDHTEEPGRAPSRREIVRGLLRGFRARSDPAGRFVDFENPTVVPLSERRRIALAAASAFYDRSADPLDPTEAATGAPPPVPPEFHSFVARCADYPELLRHLGLAFDVFVKDDPGYPEVSRIRLLPDDNEGPLRRLLDPEAARPETLFHYTERLWVPYSRERRGDVRDGSLSIDSDDVFDVLQIDPDGSALKLSNLLDTVRRTTAELATVDRSMTVDAASLPALRSAGIVVARRNRAEQLVNQFDAARAHEDDRLGATEALLEASDVTRGFRVDIQDQTVGREWMSLHRREGTYEVRADGGVEPLPVQPLPDEGYLKAASTSSAAPGTTADQYLHEAVVGWDGWSLAVKRPGRLQTEVGTVEPEVAPEVAATGFGLAAEFRPQRGSLPRLRYGRSYRVRVRAVDLAGGSIPEDQLLEEHERDLPDTYQRWEPVPAPATVPLTEYTEGESLMRMVIRSTDGVSASDYVSLDRVTGLANHAPNGIWYRADNARHLAAPATSVQLAETHGAFDAALSGNAAAVADQFAVAARESGSYLLLAGGRLVSRRDEPTTLTGQKSDVLKNGEYIVHDTPQLDLPYLPDPLSRGISFATLPGDTDLRILRWPGDEAIWYDRLPVRVLAVEGTGPPSFDEATRTLTVSLAKAEFRTVRVASALDSGDENLMRIWTLIDRDQNPATTAQRAAVLSGRHWMITPFSELTFVHAVEKPLEKPVILVGPGGPANSRVHRLPGDTFAALFGAVRTHAASTGRLDIDAEWTDRIDDIAQPTPGTEAVFAHVTGFSLERDEVDCLIAATEGPAGGPFGPRHEVRQEFGDTKHRYVSYRATATTRFREYFPPEITNDPDLVTTEGEPLRLNIPSSRRPDPPDVKYIIPTWEWTTDDLGGEGFGVRRVRTGGGLRVYLGRPWYSSGEEEILGVVLRIQPWLTWHADVERGVVGSIDAQALSDTWAAGVLERDGVSVSGRSSASAQLLESLTERVRADEAPVRARTDEERALLGTRSALAALRSSDPVVNLETVVDHFPLFGETGADGLPFTSVWGTDPVYISEPVASGPLISQFPLRTSVGHGVLLSEVGERVTVVGHAPEYDPDRQLWFCDVQVDAGDAYTPLVQLMLGRYQPHSVGDEHLSKVVKADFVQVLPRREATFVESVDRTAIVVTLSGAVGIPHHAQTLPNLASKVEASRRVEAWVEKLPADATSDLAWEEVGRRVTLPVVSGLRFLRRGTYDEVDWAGAVPVPSRQDAPVGERWRVRIAEYELHVSDREPTGHIAPFRMRDARLIYSDTVDLP
ncbi:hypothetical protein L1277_001078 [Okibacterium sp. HSC-33S16]|uniref:hypothetical protein n=1 Tax=Okibacterium sp. HSC-33S16 TaxID=2910965 RepID=UPI00209DEC42|nr:hypothetical protein [Okibacterium sp. HSC-33S16]MCP2030987.1 hypothetical protein [Okibacterium sp. HSC-33S16]